MSRQGVAFLLLFAVTVRADEGPPKIVQAWAAGPLEARVAFDREIPDSLAKSLVGTRIVFGDRVKAGDRFEVHHPRGSDADDRGSLRIAAARVEGPVLILATDPHSRDTTYALHLPAPVNADVAYRLRGVDFVWDDGRDGSQARSKGVWNSLDSSGLAREVDPIARGLKMPTRLVMKTAIALPKGKATLSAQASAPFTLEFGGESASSNPVAGGHKADVPAEVESDVIDMLWTLNLDGSKSLTFSAKSLPAGQPLSFEQLVLPWAPPRPSAATPAPVPGIFLTGGDPIKGGVLFKGERAKCAACHRVRGEGGEVGPDLSDLARRDRAWVYRQINEPSASIHPDYVPYVVQMKDGRVLAGIVRADGADGIKVVDTEAKSTVLKKSEIEELKPSATSIMPVGLLGAVGEEGVRDLIAFLTTSPPTKR